MDLKFKHNSQEGNKNLEIMKKTHAASILLLDNVPKCGEMTHVVFIGG